MRTFFFLMVLLACVMSCTENELTNNAVTLKPSKTEVLVDSLNGDYKEWYPGRLQLKFKGYLDKQGRRHGKWVHYLESGMEKSMITYTHGSREGFSIVKYDNGVVYYRGEYKNDLKTGLWTTYDQIGKIVTETNYSSKHE